MKNRPDKSWKHLFPMVVCGRTFNSFSEIDKAYGLTPGRAYMRYVRNGLRGDELARQTKRHNDVLNEKVTIGRTTRTVREWIAESHIKQKTFYTRFYEHGWPLEKACTVATGVTVGRNHYGRNVTWRGTTYRMVDFARKCGLTSLCVKHRLDVGWTPQQIYDRPADCTKHYKRNSNLGTIKSELHKAAHAAKMPYGRVHNRLRHGWTLEEALTRPLHDRTVAMARRRRDQAAALGIVI